MYVRGVLGRSVDYILIFRRKKGDKVPFFQQKIQAIDKLFFFH